MELIMQLMLGLSLLSLFFQMSQWSITFQLIVVLVISGIAYAIYPWVIEQSIGQLNQWIADKQLMQNIAALQISEAVLFIGVDFYRLKNGVGKPIKKHIFYLTHFVGAMWFLALVYFQMHYFIAISQVPFEQLAWYFTFGVGLFFLVIPRVFKWLIPDFFIRMELRYMLCIGQIICAIIITIICQSIPYEAAYNTFKVNSLIGIVILVCFLFCLGWGWSSIKNKIQLKWKF